MAVLVFLGWLAQPGICRADDPFPYDTDSGTEAGLIFASCAAFGLGWWLDRDFRPLIPEEADALDPETLNPLDRPAARMWSPGADRASDFLVTGQVIAPLGLNFGDQGSRQPGKITVMYLETMALESGLAYLLKNAFNRSRPLVYNDDPAVSMELKTSRNARKSFPSGHTANAFASMVFLAGVYDELNPESSGSGAVWAACLGSAAATGVLRVVSGRHFTSDVLAGAVLGTITGLLVPRLHEIDAPGTDAGGSSPGVAISFRLGF